MERSRGVAIEAFPGGFVNFGFEVGFELLVRITRTQKIGVADEEAFFIVVRINKPAGNAVGSARFNAEALPPWPPNLGGNWNQSSQNWGFGGNIALQGLKDSSLSSATP
ncbi:MAG: hypothetical protein ACRC8A_20130 [Microcoleaceae cyanobacterium]